MAAPVLDGPQNAASPTTIGLTQTANGSMAATTHSVSFDHRALSHDRETRRHPCRLDGSPPTGMGSRPLRCWGRSMSPGPGVTLCSTSKRARRIAGRGSLGLRLKAGGLPCLSPSASVRARCARSLGATDAEGERQGFEAPHGGKVASPTQIGLRPATSRCPTGHRRRRLSQAP